MITVDQRPNTELSREELVKKIWRLEEYNERLLMRLAGMTPIRQNAQTDNAYKKIIAEQRHTIAKLRENATIDFVHENISILEYVASFYGFTKDELTSKARHKPLVIARTAYTYLMLKIGKGYSEIGRMLKRDHSTIISLEKRIYNYLDEFTLQSLNKFIEHGSKHHQGGKFPGSSPQASEQVSENQRTASV